ncbi:hypothetical protein TIFTF001_012910 [Ficus carica]|uniref:Ankyrin repeat protein n=1 Tax=Ficus carica TaxID=3494 RepID=A0AA88AP07_FICCA|nr:hypothetical protein TIFTF001_012910 [Ficus carica]
MGVELNSAEETANVAAAADGEANTPENIEALIAAARYDDLDDVVSLESAGVSLDSKDSLGRTALHMASANGYLEIVEYLISKGVVRQLSY